MPRFETPSSFFISLLLVMLKVIIPTIGYVTRCVKFIIFAQKYIEQYDRYNYIPIYDANAHGRAH